MKQLGATIYCSVVTFGFIAQCVMLYLREIPTSQRDIALIVVGALIASFKDVGNYFTGSTASSQSKDATIAQIATAPTAQGATIKATGITSDGVAP